MAVTFVLHGWWRTS
ncbi:trp operon leader peptide [Salmonella enterica]|nr:trp operon leader peptide [Salmonella enterica]HCM1951412.1 trp operon leader peptide [Salmonella enterica subsp. salamae serovar 9,46:z4,z24:z39:z42]HCM1955860.1 trp operon leader peptide [Salmonella enterica subsp. salamae serovar 9,46:z4,z24:z39:z42]HCM1982292.1 trp operon leader peptide [Salmonella enterica subsp. houtenae serovar 41:z36:-]